MRKIQVEEILPLQSPPLHPHDSITTRALSD